MSLTNQVKNITGVTNQVKNSGTLSDQSKNGEDLEIGESFLLTELTGYLLQENGNKIVLETTKEYLNFPTLTKQVKTSGTLTNQAK